MFEVRVHTLCSVSPGSRLKDPEGDFRLLQDLISDRVAPCAAGRTIAGTGTLDIDGRVGDIGGIEAKARAAAAAGAQLLLAPADQAAAARSVLGTRIPVIGVTTFQQAIDALHPSTTPAA